MQTRSTLGYVDVYVDVYVYVRGDHAFLYCSKKPSLLSEDEKPSSSPVSVCLVCDAMLAAHVVRLDCM